MSILNPGSKQKEKGDVLSDWIIICIGAILPVIIIIHAIISAGYATYHCYESKTDDGFQVKTGWELIEMQFEGDFDYEEIIKIDNDMSEKGDY